MSTDGRLDCATGARLGEGLVGEVVLLSLLQTVEREQQVVQVLFSPGCALDYLCHQLPGTGLLPALLLQDQELSLSVEQIA